MTISRHTHRLQKLIRACIGFSFSPETFEGITFRIQGILTVRSRGGGLGGIKVAAVIDDIVAFFFTTAGLFCWVRIW